VDAYEIYTLAGAALLTTLLQLVAHYVEKPKEPRLLVRYVWGTIILWVGFAAWRFLNGDWITPLGLAAIDATAGVAVIGSYAWDRTVERIRQARMIEGADDELQNA
jgi:hypothetical protein